MTDQVCGITPMLIAARANLTPHALAVAAYDDVLDYAQLDRSASRVAGYLSDRGVGAGTIVAVCMERSAAFVVGALGVLQTGAAYLPIDPAHPAPRVAFMLEDAAVPFVLTHERVRGRLPQGDWDRICLDGDAARLNTSCGGRRTLVMSRDDPAYVIYTSGSTGLPKGVEVLHRNLSNLVGWHRRAFALVASDRTTALAGPGFDAAVWELWPALASGASIHIPDESIRTDPERLREWLVAEQITVSFAPTMLAEALMELEWPAPTALRILLTGGDALRRYPRPTLPFAVVNNYGPTEATVVATSGIVPSDRDWRDAPPTIGSPIDNVRIHVVDGTLQPVADGQVGEICIGGAGVARGYLNRSELTAERFVDDPFADTPRAQLYRTGDLARRLPSGELAFVGRIDDQVQLRGYRIEPNEIVTTLDRHPAVSASAVIAREDGPEKRLIAYVVPSGAEALSERGLRQFLEGSLPAYMIPAAFVRLDSLPVTPNGKIDRASLPPPDGSNRLHDPVAATAATGFEVIVAGTVARLLDLPDVRVDENVFLLGGHSLFGAQLIAQLRETFGIELTLRAVFESPTIAALAARIEQLAVAKVLAMDESEILAAAVRPE